MNCPKCAVTLSVSERQGVEIDYCPQCRGVWLDRGELDKVIERASRFEEGDEQRPEQRQDYRPDYRREPRYDARDDGRSDDHGRPRHPGDYKSQHGHRRKSFWQELFD